MKNIHVLPTDKLSRFSLNSSGKYHLTKQLYTNSPNFIAKHIYVTSNEEIKDIRPYKGKWQLEQGLMLNKFPTYLTDLSECKLVIMTTDQELIKDGVQAIDDKFLEWFVKNPNCEEVEVKKGFADGTAYGYNFLDYKIIIPNEEPNYNSKLEIEWISNNQQCKQIESCYNSLSKKCICPKEEPKQELVKDLAYWKANAEEDYMKVPISVLRYISELENQMCGDEEVFNLCRAFATFVMRKGPSYKKQQEWFEQFKKKQ